MYIASCTVIWLCKVIFSHATVGLQMISFQIKTTSQILSTDKNNSAFNSKFSMTLLQFSYKGFTVLLYPCQIIQWQNSLFQHLWVHS